MASKTVLEYDPSDSGVITELSRFRVSDDVVKIIRIVEVDGQRVIDVRDWIVSAQCWGRGVWLPGDRDIVLRIADALVRGADRVAI